VAEGYEGEVSDLRATIKDNEKEVRRKIRRNIYTKYIGH